MVDFKFVGSATGSDVWGLSGGKGATKTGVDEIEINLGAGKSFVIKDSTTVQKFRLDDTGDVVINPATTASIILRTAGLERLYLKNYDASADASLIVKYLMAAWGVQLGPLGSGELLKRQGAGVISARNNGDTLYVDFWAKELRGETSVLTSLTYGGTVGRVLYPAIVDVSASTTAQVNVPSGSKVIGVLWIVKTAVSITGGTGQWSGAYTAGVGSQAISSAQAVAKDTAAEVFFDPNSNNPVASAEVDIDVSADGGGSFNSGEILFVAVAETMSGLTAFP